MRYSMAAVGLGPRPADRMAWGKRIEPRDDYVDSLAATSTEKLDGQLGDGLESINFLIPGGYL